MIGTTGFDVEALREAASTASANAFVAPNFAIGAVLMMRFAAEASRHMQRAEIIEYHHPAKLDAPSGTAARTAELMEGDVPIHSVRLPGLVADQDVILGDVAQTLTLRHVTTDRTSFMPGVLLAVRARRGAARPAHRGARAAALALSVARRRHRPRRRALPPARARDARRPQPEIAARVGRAWAAGDVSREPPPGAAAQRGSAYVRDGDIVYVCLRGQAARGARRRHAVGGGRGADGPAPLHRSAASATDAAAEPKEGLALA